MIMRKMHIIKLLFFCSLNLSDLCDAIDSFTRIIVPIRAFEILLGIPKKVTALQWDIARLEELTFYSPGN